MITKTIFDCVSIVEKLDADLNVTGYDVIDKDGQKCFYPQCKVNSITGSTNRLAISDVLKSGSPEVITSMRQECFCTDDENREYHTYTTASET